MIDTLTPYPAYKDSDLPWLGQVPEHWEIKRGKSYLFAVDIRSKTGTEELLTVSSARGVVPRKSANVTMFKAESYAGYKLCWPGDLVINSLWAWGGGLGVSQHHGIISTAYSVYRCRTSTHINPRFLHELVRSSAFNWELQVRSKGIWISRLQLTDTAFLDAPIPLPPPAEQAAIVRFLEWAGGRLERTIRAKRRQLQLMKERVVVATENSIHGDDVKWKRLSNISHQMLRPVERQKDQQYTRIGLYNRGRGIFHKPAVIGSDLGDSEFFYVSDGDFVISGQFAWEGAVALARNKEAGCIASHRYPILRGIESIVLSSFLFSFFRSSYGSMLLDVHSRGAAGRNRPLNAERLFREYVPVPSLHTQHKISEVLEEEFALSDTIEREIELLREYRNRLIADVVTGKLDVRAVAATLPDDAALDLQSDDIAAETSVDDSDSLEDV